MKGDKPKSQPPAPAPATTQEQNEVITSEAAVRARAKNEPEVMRALHGHVFASQMLEKSYESAMGKSIISETSQEFSVDLLKQLNVRDPLEQMLIHQMVWTHVRIGRLTTLATQQTGLKQVQVVNEAADRALNAFRRQLLALSEYRNPKPPQQFTAIKQQNIAGQQVVQNTLPAKSQKESVTNEKELCHATPETKALRLSLERIAFLRSSIQRVQPWRWATGPKTPQGKARSSRNAVKHGGRSREVVNARKELAAIIREVRAIKALERLEADNLTI